MSVIASSSGAPIWYTIHVTYSTVTSVVVIIKINIQTFKVARPLQLSVETLLSLSHSTGGVLQPQLTKTESKCLCDEEYKYGFKTLILLHHNLLTILTTHCSEQFFIYFKETQSYASKLSYVRIRTYDTQNNLRTFLWIRRNLYVRTLSYENFRGIRTTLVMNRPPGHLNAWATTCHPTSASRLVCCTVVNCQHTVYSVGGRYEHTRPPCVTFVIMQYTWDVTWHVL